MRKTNTSRQWWDLPAAILLIATMLAAASRLVATRWTEDLSLIQFIAVSGSVLGLAIGVSKFSASLSAFLGIAYGVIVIPWRLGLLMEEYMPWTERVTTLALRINDVFTQLINQEAVTDSVLFLLLMSILFWALSVHAGYTLMRYGNAWAAVIPTGLVLFVIHAFDAMVTRRAWYLAVYIFMALVLIARMAYLHHQSRWKQSRTALPPHLGLDFIRFALAAVGIIVILSWTIPTLASTVPAIVSASQPLREIWYGARDRVDNAFAALRSSVGVVNDYYGISASLGRGNPLSDFQVFNAEIPPNTPAGVRYYWRAKVYDTYREGQWVSSEYESERFDPEQEDPQLPSDRTRWVSTIEFTAATNLSSLYLPSQPLWVSRISLAQQIINSDENSEYISFRATPAIRPGQTYQAQSAISFATETELRSAGTEYPEWIIERYLQLPSSITQRTIELAQEITTGQLTPYDKALAITNWLRENITYQDTIDAPPRNQEPLDWFLFDYRKGFCNYYSSAAIVLLRAVGVPARWALGYAQGEEIDATTFLVRERHAHAWPEVYFPGYGWIEFEPTSSQPQIARLPGNDSDLASEFSIPSTNFTEEEQRLRELQQQLQQQREERLRLQEVEGAQSTLLNFILLGITIIIMGFAGYFIWRSRHRLQIERFPVYIESTMIRFGIQPPAFIRRWAARMKLPPLSKSYQEINYALNRLGANPSIDDTPSERAAILGKIVPRAAAPANQLVNEYQIGIFSNQQADLSAANSSSKKVRYLSIRAKLNRWLEKFQRLTKPSNRPY